MTWGTPPLTLSLSHLRSGIENMLKHYIPEISSVEQAFDEMDRVSAQELEKLEKRIGEWNSNEGEVSVKT